MYEDLNDIYHHGVKGMKWGVRRTPEQLGYKPKPKKPKKTREEKLKERAKKKKAQIDKKEAKLRAEAEAKRSEILKSPRKLYKYRENFTKEEIDEAMKQFKWEQNLKKFSKQDIQRGQDFIENVLSWADTGMRSYNTVAKLYNTFSGVEGKDRWKEIPGVGSSGKKKN